MTLVSVIIPTRHRNDALAACLARLAPGTQTLAADLYEVIVTDDGVETTADALVGDRFPWARWIRGPGRGPAANRNNGAAHAHGRWLVFTDDDCLPDRACLMTYVNALDETIDVLEGAIHPDRPVTRDLEECPTNLDGGHLWTANLCIRASTFNQIGGFDERDRYPAHEDADFAIRLGDATNRMRFLPDAIVTHPVRRLCLGDMMARTSWHADAWGMHAAKHFERLGFTSSWRFASTTVRMNLRYATRHARCWHWRSAIAYAHHALIGTPRAVRAFGAHRRRPSETAPPRAGQAYKPTISIVMATFNGARHLRAQLDSIGAQTLRPAEIVINDDRSSDDTCAIIEAFARTTDIPVRLEVNAERLRHQANFMRAGGRAMGELIAFADQDDVWMPDKLEACAAVFHDPNIVLCMHAADVADGDLRPSGFRLPDIAADAVYCPNQADPWHPAPGFSLVFRRTLLDRGRFECAPDDHMGPGETIGHDHYVYMLAGAFGSIAHLRRTLVRYRRHETNTTAPVRRGLLRTIHLTLDADAAFYRRLADQAARRAMFFASLADAPPSSLGGVARDEHVRLARQACAFYRETAARLAARADIYADGSIGRVQAYLRLARAGGYRSRRAGAFGPKSALKDGLRCVIPSAIVRIIGRSVRHAG